MGVFGGSTKIDRAVADPGTDDTLPSSGALSWGGITGAAGVAGTTGADAKLVHGDRWQQVSGNHTENVSSNLLTTIQGNRTQNVMGDQDLTTTGNVTGTIVGNMNHTVVGAELHTNVGAQNHTRMAPRVETYAGTENKDEPGMHIHSVDEWIKSHNLNAEVVGYKMEAVGFKAEACGIKLEVSGPEMHGHEIWNEVTAMKNQAVIGLKLYAGALRNQICAMALIAKLATASVNPEVHLPTEATIVVAPSPR